MKNVTCTLTNSKDERIGDQPSVWLYPQLLINADHFSEEGAEAEDLKEYIRHEVAHLIEVLLYRRESLYKRNFGLEFTTEEEVDDDQQWMIVAERRVQQIEQVIRRVI